MYLFTRFSFHYFKNIRSTCINSICLKYCTSTKSSNDYIPIYKFPYIRPLSIVNQLKKYQTVLTAVAVPGSILMYQMNQLPKEAIYATSVLGVTGCITFYALGYLTDKFVGFIYINKKEDTVKVSYIDFWGYRKDEVIPIVDVKPFSDIPVASTDRLFLKLQRYSSNNSLKLNITHGQVVNLDKFNKVFL